MLQRYLIHSYISRINTRFLSFSNKRYSKTSLPLGQHKKKKTHYEVLGLKQDASVVDVRAAFVKLSKEIHPDKNPDDPENHAKFVLLNEAYTVLSKPQSRKEYDLSLAHWLYIQQTIARSGYSSHTAGNSPTPGFGSNPESYDGDGQQRTFWDETIWHMRDRSKDANAFYDKDSYYGIKGIQRQSNSVIVAVCVFIIVCGFVYFYVAFKYTTKKQQERLENIDRKNLKLLKEIRETAKQNGTAKQLQILHARQLPNDTDEIDGSSL